MIFGAQYFRTVFLCSFQNYLKLLAEAQVKETETDHLPQEKNSSLL